MSVFLNSKKYSNYHQAGHWAKDCPSPTMNTLRGGLCSLLPYDNPKKDSNSSTSFMAMLSNLGRCFRCHQLGHWVKDCPLSAGINGRGGEGPLSSANGFSGKDVRTTTTFITMSSKSDQCFKSHQLGNQAKESPSSIGVNARGGLVSSDVLEKNTNTSTSNTAALLISDKFSICDQPRHLVKDHHSTIAINARVEGPVSFVTSDIIEKESETMSITYSENDANSTTNMTMLPNWDKCFEPFEEGNWAKECPSVDGNNDGGGEAASSATCGSFEDVSSTSSCNCMPSKLDKCQQPGHWAKECSLSTGADTGREGPISSTTHSENDSNSTTDITMLPKWDKCFKCFQQGHWANKCPSSNGNNIGGEAVSSTTCEISKKDVNPTSSCICMPSKSDKCQQPGYWAKDCPSRKSNSSGGPDSSSSYNVPQKICICGRGPCVILTSKTTKNPGRKFYKCSFRECGFFEWCDGQASPSKDNNPLERLGQQQFTSTSPTNTNDGCRRIVKGYDLSTRCPCGAGPCPVRTAKTQKNMGRQFVCCPVRKGDGSCGFFKWCDELDSAASAISSVTNSSLFATSKHYDSLGRNDT